MVNYACEKADGMTVTRKRKYGRKFTSYDINNLQAAR